MFETNIKNMNSFGRSDMVCYACEKDSPSLIDSTVNPGVLAAAAVQSLIQQLLSGTACCIGIALIAMRTDRFLQTKNSFIHAVNTWGVSKRSKPDAM
jgi:hypothetical protein